MGKPFARTAFQVITSVVTGCIWVVCATIVAFLPMRYQYLPGAILLVVAPFIIGWMAWNHGWWIALIGVFALVSMFRRPLYYYYRRARGERPTILQ